MTQTYARSDLIIACPIHVLDSPADRLNRLVARRTIRDMNPDTVLHAMINHSKHICIPARTQHRRRHIRSPQHVRNIGRYPAIVLHFRTPRTACRGEKSIFTHHAQHPLPRYPHWSCRGASYTELCADLAVAFPMERTCRNDRLDTRQQQLVGDFLLRTTFSGRDVQSYTRIALVNTGTRDAPGGANPLDAVLSLRGDRP